MRSLLLLGLLLVCVAHASDVLILGPENFDNEVGGDVPVLVEFFAPWCGHCKSLAPEYDVLATTFKGLPVKIASVDADKHRDLGSRFGIQGFPTLKFFPAGSKEGEAFSGGRTAADMTDYINKRVGTNARIKKAPSAVTVLTEANFDEIVLNKNKNVLVEFYAPWCGHCKKLEPEYEKVGKSFEGEDEVVVAKVDADAHRELGTRFGVQGYPTIKFFPKDNKEGIEYTKGRTPQDFVDFLNEEAHTERLLGGDYMETAGRIEELDALAAKFVDADKAEQQKLIEEADKLAKESTHKNAKFAKFYTIAMKKIASSGSGYLEQEASRLSRLMSGGNIKPADAGQFAKRKNILKAFQA